ncbi:MAG TPA: cyclic nucleotide-binding domain-containing protein [Deltaproteobacteria bacterium]|nr:cyclic nucleotide-binding domain-containing protein [Deltaproteobacteria bacterium]
MGAPSQPTQGSNASRTVLLDPTDVGDDLTLDCTATAGSGESTPPTLHPPQPGDELRARYRYRVLRRLGRGGFGSVFLARCLDGKDDLDGEGPPKLVALKVMARPDDPQARNSLKRELAALLAVRHDRIPKLYDWNIDGETAFAAIQYFPAGSLADAWPFLGRLTAEQTWRLLSDLMQALGAAHRASVLHLDVKPSNVLLDGNGGYVLTDFGVSHSSRMSRGLLHQGHLSIGLGTHGYRAPEQASAKVQSFDLRTDLWGVGATAWALFTGIDLNRRQDVLRTREEGNIYGLKSLSDIALDCPPPLEEIVMGMLCIDPARRPGGTGEVLARIRAIASGFGLDTATIAASRRDQADPAEIARIIETLVDPLWASICRGPGFDRYFVRFNDGETIAGVADPAQHTVLLLRGQIVVEVDDREVAVESREGTFLGAISTLTGARRHAHLRARGTTWCCLFNEAELEQLVTCNPAIAVRIIRSMADRIASGPPRHRA